jgi:hypothetical protein
MRRSFRKFLGCRHKIDIVRLLERRLADLVLLSVVLPA